LVKPGQAVEKGQFLTDGSADIEELYEFGGIDKAREYIISEILKIYDLQGINVSRKHLEVIVKQMFSRRIVKHAGDSELSAGTIIEEGAFMRINEELEAAGKEQVKGLHVVLGITDVALTRNSWLSSASFQNTTRKLTEAAVRGAVDVLNGLNENVIVGRIIPAGTGFGGSKKFGMVQSIQKQINERLAAEEAARQAEAGEQSE
jgi:DNA-directed RNA polymerase subunit beta'